MDLIEIALKRTARLAVHYGIRRMEELLPAHLAKAYVSGVFLLIELEPPTGTSSVHYSSFVWFESVQMA